MTIQQQHTIRIIKELENNPEPDLSIAELLAVLKYLEKLKKDAAKHGKNDTYIDGIRLIF